jgi:hypothetical protein
MTTTSPTNPYEPPREPAPRAVPDFSDRDAVELADLRRRVAELESKVQRSWFTSGNILHRVVAVWGYLLLGYIALVAAIMGLMMVVSAVSGDF